MRLGQLVIELAANTARLQTDMGKAVGIAERGAASIKKAFTFVTAGVGGGLIGGSLLGAARSAITLGDELNKAAIKSGVGAKSFTELAYAAQLADVDLASLSNALKKMQINLSEASTGAKAPIAALKALGLTIQDLNGKGADETFEVLGDRISQLKDPAERTRAAVELFGKAGADLLPLFSQGAEGIRKAREEAEKLGFAFGEDQLQKLADADDAIKRLDLSWQAFGITLTSKVAKPLTNVLDALSSGAAARVGEGFLKGGFVGGINAALDVRRDIGNDEYDSNRRGVISRPSDAPTGFAASDAAARAREAFDAATKEQAAFLDRMDTRMRETYDAVDDMSRDSLRRQQEDWLENEDEKAAFLKRFQEQGRFVEDAKISESAAFFRDTFLAAFDDVVNTGKFKFSNFLSFIAAEIARRGIAQLFANATSSAKADAGGSKGGWWNAVGNFFGSIFAGGKANGGQVLGGNLYAVGERGPELFAPGVSGSIIPNDKLGGKTVSIVSAPTINFNGGRGGREDARRMRRALQENERRTFDELDRRGMTA